MFILIGLVVTFSILVKVIFQNKVTFILGTGSKSESSLNKTEIKIENVKSNRVRNQLQLSYKIKKEMKKR